MSISTLIGTYDTAAQHNAHLHLTKKPALRDEAPPHLAPVAAPPLIKTNITLNLRSGPKSTTISPKKNIRIFLSSTATMLTMTNCKGRSLTLPERISRVVFINSKFTLVTFKATAGGILVMEGNSRAKEVCNGAIENPT